MGANFFCVDPRYEAETPIRPQCKLSTHGGILEVVSLILHLCSVDKPNLMNANSNQSRSKVVFRKFCFTKASHDFRYAAHDDPSIP